MSINFNINEHNIEARISVHNQREQNKYSVRLSFWGRPASEQSIQAFVKDLHAKCEYPNLSFAGKARVALSQMVQYERIELSYELSDEMAKMDRLTTLLGFKISI